MRYRASITAVKEPPVAILRVSEPNVVADILDPIVTLVTCFPTATLATHRSD
jgi:hypothetical protein